MTKDQYLCANKGFNSYSFSDKNNCTKINNLSIPKQQTLERVAENFYLIPRSNKERNSDAVLSKIQSNQDSTEKIIAIRDIALDSLSLKIKGIIKQKNF